MGTNELAFVEAVAQVLTHHCSKCVANCVRKRRIHDTAMINHSENYSVGVMPTNQNFHYIIFLPSCSQRWNESIHFSKQLGSWACLLVWLSLARQEGTQVGIWRIIVHPNAINLFKSLYHTTESFILLRSNLFSKYMIKYISATRVIGKRLNLHYSKLFGVASTSALNDRG